MDDGIDVEVVSLEEGKRSEDEDPGFATLGSGIDVPDDPPRP